MPGENRIDQRMPPEPNHRLLSPFRNKRHPRNPGFKKTLLRERPNPPGNGRSKGWRGGLASYFASTSHRKGCRSFCIQKARPGVLFCFGGRAWSKRNSISSRSFFPASAGRSRCRARAGSSVGRARKGKVARTGEFECPSPSTNSLIHKKDNPYGYQGIARACQGR